MFLNPREDPSIKIKPALKETQILDACKFSESLIKKRMMGYFLKNSNVKYDKIYKESIDSRIEESASLFKVNFSEEGQFNQ